MGTIESQEYWGKNITRLVDYGIAARLNLRSVKLFADGVSQTTRHFQIRATDTHSRCAWLLWRSAIRTSSYRVQLWN